METTTKKNRVVIVKTRSGKDKRTIPIEFRIEITPEKELGPITALDPEGNEYVVSFDLTPKKLTAKKGGGPICCCHNKNSQKRICYKILPGQPCPCKN